MFHIVIYLPYLFYRYSFYPLNSLLAVELQRIVWPKVEIQLVVQFLLRKH